ncbi:MAG: hypothetical protein WBW73_27880, partial [Rhodoplanes sp.]
YKARARIEQAVGKLKRFKRIALRCEKTARNYGSFVALALGLILIKSVHTALALCPVCSCQHCTITSAYFGSSSIKRARTVLGSEPIGAGSLAGTPPGGDNGAADRRRVF